MNVYFIPLASGRFEPYYEQEEPDEAAPADGATPGFFARLAARFSQMVREAERERHEQIHQPPASAMARLRRTLMGWVAEHVAEQRLLWKLRRADRATLHVPDDMADATALPLLRRGLQKDADRHLRLLALHAIGLVASAPFIVLPGPNIFGYFFTFTVVGHFLAYRGARRGASAVAWNVVPNPALTTMRLAMSAAPPECYRLIHEAAEQLRLPRVARFVERMAARPA
ncbi:MAG: hypothetical protein IT180_14760 [Acidobacteria bacterium]|nr:hypothetical protein [Acidobacteriota bacterium]